MLSIKLLLRSAIAGILMVPPALCQIPAATVPAETPLAVTVDGPLPMRVHQSVHAHLLYPVYVDGVLILPETTSLDGTVTALQPNRPQRNNARLNGDFTPFHIPVVRFTSLSLADGRSFAVSTEPAMDGAPIYRLAAPAPRKGGFVRRQYDAGMQIFHDQLSQITAPHKGDRLLQLFYHQLPYHPERIESGTSWTVETTAPVLIPQQASQASAPAPQTHESEPSVANWKIQAYLKQGLSSATSRVGQPIRAVVAEPVYNPDHTVAVPQGATLIGAVTRAKPARSFSRAGELRFDFKQITMPGGETRNVQAALSHIDANAAADLQMNEEGKIKPKPQDKVIVPLILAFLATRPLDEDRGFQGGRNFVGANGFGLAGNIIGWAGGSRNIAAGIGAYGTAISLYRRWIASGHQVTFPRDTRVVLDITARRSTRLTP